MRKNTTEDILSRYEPIPESGCWIFLGAGHEGYASVKWNGRESLAHRVFYENLVGPIQAGLVMDHLCRVRCCVNPAHLEAVTLKENIQRGINSTRVFCKFGHKLPEKGQCLACKKQRAYGYTKSYRLRQAAAKDA